MPTGDPLTSRPPQARWDLKLAAWLHAVGLQHLQAPLEPAEVELVDRAVRWADGVDRLEVEPSSSPPTGTVTRVHPLSGEGVERQQGSATGSVEAVVRHLLEGESDPRRSLLRLWRIAPDAAFAEPALRQATRAHSDWRHLPARPHLPAVTLWERARLASAFAGCLSLDPVQGESLALLVVSLGPVQDFIAEARSTSDLWAGSHLVAQLSWEAMRPICEAYGPDSLLVPDLHGVPVVDRWLAGSDIDLAGLGPSRWQGIRSDAHPLFVATLPNRFHALVPTDLDPALLDEIHHAPRRWLTQRCQRGWAKLLAASPLSAPPSSPADQQIDDQLGDFPEVHPLYLPWGPEGVRLRAGGVESPEDLLAQFHAEDDPPASPRAGALGQEVISGTRTVYRPSGSLITGMIGEIADHLHAAGKATRAFSQLRQDGYRCTLCGEREWLTLDRALLPVRPTSHRKGCPWCLLAERRPAWVKPGDHLCAVCLLKRLWPAVLLEELRELEPGSPDPVARYVVSTHAMALAPSLEKLIESAGADADELAFVDAAWHREWKDWSALPRSIAQRLPEGSPLERRIRRLPLLLDELREQDLPAAHDLERRLASPELLGHVPEAYYGLILMDGDGMGRWFAGDLPTPPLTVGDLWEPRSRQRFAEEHPELKPVLSSRRPADARHLTALSGAIHGFGIDLVRRIVEEHYKGRLLYCGGDDLMAMVAVDDLIEVALTLRTAFSGLAVTTSEPFLADRLPWIHDGSLAPAHGFVDYDEGRHRHRVRTLGPRATASLGAVVCHYAAPLGLALRELRATEARAKSDGGRDAFALTLLKRSGGVQAFTARWFAGAGGPPLLLDTSPLGLLLRLRGALAVPVSRRAVYLLGEILEGLGDHAPTGALESVVRYQLLRQASDAADPASIERLAHDLATVSEHAAPERRSRFLIDLLLTAEFLARESRAGVDETETALEEAIHV